MIVGLGCRANVSAEDVLALIARALDGRPATALATIASKVSEPGVIEAAATLGLPLLAVDFRAIEAAQARCVTSSAIALAVTGVASVAEGAALAAAGPRAKLVLARITDGRVTVALAA